MKLNFIIHTRMPPCEAGLTTIVDPRGIGPLSTPCHGVILPVYYEPQLNNLKCLKHYIIKNSMKIKNLKLKILRVDLSGFEPLISAMRMQRITSCATGPD